MELNINRGKFRRKPGDEAANELFSEEPIIYLVSRPNLRYNHALGATDFYVASFRLVFPNQARLRFVLPGPCVSFMRNLVAN
jgi:hypothetical protein